MTSTVWKPQTLYGLLQVQNPRIQGPVQVGNPKRLHRYLHVGDPKDYRGIYYKLEIPNITGAFTYWRSQR
jgi:hypothetical protein